MKRIYQLTLCLFIIAFSSCELNFSTRSILLNSGDIINIMEACQEIIDAEEVDTSLVVPLLTHIFDQRMSTELEFTHHNPYFMRLNALERITGEKHNYDNWLDTEFDALVVDAYLNWCLEQGLIKDKKEIYLFQPPEYHEFSSESVIERIKNSDKVDWLAHYNWPARKRGILHSK